MKLWWGCVVGLLGVIGAAGADQPPSPPAAAVSPERLQQLIQQLGDPKFKLREQAAAELSRLGRLALRALQDAARDSKDLEVRNRAKALAEAIQAHDRPRSALLTLLARVQQARPAPGDRQVARAIYLLSVARPPTEAELNAVEKRLQEASDKQRAAEDLMWPLLTGRDFNDKLADFNQQVVKLKQKLAGATLAEKLHDLNGQVVQPTLDKMTERLKAALDKRSDDEVVDALFLVLLARFPSAQQSATALAFIKKTGNRDKAMPDILWALLSTKEFLLEK
jgi:hypothetical protein